MHKVQIIIINILNAFQPRLKLIVNLYIHVCKPRLNYKYQLLIACVK